MKPSKNDPRPGRRDVLLGILATPLVGGLGCSSGSEEYTLPSSDEQPPTPACDDGDEPTASTSEGPYFKTSSPERTTIADAGEPGTPFVIQGTVETRSCQPVAGALLEFWHADDAGEYDNDGFRLRGHLFTDDAGRYQVTTIVPGIYSGRTRHVHVKVQPQGGTVLTTQLFFPGEDDNDSDSIYRDDLRMFMEQSGDGFTGTFVFVVDLP